MVDFVGGADDDIFTGGTGNDTIAGNGGNDTLNGDTGDDVVSGGSGADTLRGGDGGDRIFAGNLTSPFGNPSYANPPVLDSGTDVDTLFGDGGDDRLFAGYGDNVDGGANGFTGDYLYISFEGAPSGVTVNFNNATNIIGGGTITNVEHISWVNGSNYDDDITIGDVGNGYADFTVVFGMAGNDRLVGSYYTSVLDGGDGNDFLDLRPSQYAQAAYGGAGADIIYTPSNSSSSSYGGDGNDTIYAGSGMNHGGNGDDIITVVSSYYFQAALGEAGNDTLNGSDINGDALFGGDGADYIRGNGGSDTLYSANRDPATGSGLADIGNEFDQLFGDNGDDTIYAGYGDAVDGGIGTDTLHLSLGGAPGGVVVNLLPVSGGTTLNIAGAVIQNIERINSLAGTAFADHFNIATQSNAIILNAGDGDDVVQSDLSTLNLNLGNGNDRFVSGRAADIINGGNGSDTVDYRLATSGVTVALSLTAGGTGTGGGSDQLTNIENIDGSNFSDTIDGNNDANILSGQDGGDIMRGYGGNDVLIGGNGSDTMTGGVGDDLYFADQFDTIIELNGGGNDRILASNDFALNAGSYVETISTVNDSGTNAINLTGNELANWLIGNAGANILSGGAGNDTLVGDAGDDSLFGGDGNDSFYGGSGLDYLYGGLGDDTFVVNGSDDIVVEAAGEGNDTIITTALSFALGANVDNLTASGVGNFTFIGNADRNILTSGSGVDELYGLGGNDDLYGFGGNDYISGGDGADYLSGGDGNDLMVGGAGEDTVLGGLGDDSYYQITSDDLIVEYDGQGNDRIFTEVDYVLRAGSYIETLGTTSNAGTANINLTGNELANVIVGNAGTNQLDGGAGSDTLYGGAALDYFYFSSTLGAGNVDTLGDFVSVDDILMVDQRVFTGGGLVAGSLDVAAFLSGAGETAATTSAHRFIHNSTTGDLYYDADGVGGAAAVRFANIGAGTSIQHYDFFVI